MIKDKYKYYFVKFWGWLHIIVSIISIFVTINIIYSIPNDIFFLMVLSDLVFFVIGYFILKYQKKAKEIIFLEYLTRL